ncbi:MAG: TetR/AcrR family transcriptional regulator [Lachnospiraceae bacterium]|nr:TetR/AcrR family transcriptional regulator [Lachnospiraceae bacterium]MBP3477706.1 TetR/AcrR family transcriptional regulator [Lachnospiraceae bacterium]
MARKETITKNDILNAAFEMAREEGISQVSARTLAARAGCSTQPIFRVYKNMEELGEELFARAIEFFGTYYEAFPKKNDTPFVNLGLAYIHFAQEEQQLFRLLFLSENRHGKSLYDMLNGKTGAVVKEINNAKFYGCKSPSEMFMKMWIFIHGAACMSLTDDYDLQEEDTIKLLEECYSAFQNI